MTEYLDFLSESVFVITKIKTMKNQTFEQFLNDKHANQYQGLDDEMPDDRNDWLENLDVQEVLDFVEEWEKGTDNTRKRHLGEFLLLADACEKKGWDLVKFIKYMLLINEKTEAELKVLTKQN